MPHIRTFGYLFKKGHRLIPHSDMSPFSPWMAQLFYIPSKTSFKLFIGTNDIVKSHTVLSEDIYIFHTFPSDIVCATSVVEDDVYVINFLPSFSSELNDNWIFKDAHPIWEKTFF